MNEIVTGAGVRRTEAWEYEAAITDQTADIAYAVNDDSEPPLEQGTQARSPGTGGHVGPASAHIQPAQIHRHGRGLGPQYDRVSPALRRNHGQQDVGGVLLGVLDGLMRSPHLGVMAQVVAGVVVPVEAREVG